MKTAIYIEDGVVQLVLTPEGDFEKNALASFRDKPTSTHIYHGQFYDCQGGWARQHEVYQHPLNSRDVENSLILRIDSRESATV